jgi:hypothetical protein
MTDLPGESRRKGANRFALAGSMACVKAMFCDLPVSHFPHLLPGRRKGGV